MKIENVNQLKLKLKGPDADNFKTAIKKIVEEHKTIGFNRSNLNQDEVEVIKKISEQIK